MESMQSHFDRSKTAQREIGRMFELQSERDDFGKAMLRAKSLFEKADLEDKDRATLEGLFEDVDVKSLTYLETVIDYFSAMDAHLTHPRGRGGEDENWLMQRDEADDRRTLAHNALIDAVRIFVRNAQRLNVPHMDAYREFVVDPKDEARRRWIGRLAIVHGFTLLLDAVLQPEPEKAL